MVVVFEGRDAAGKGSTIKRVAEYLNPRIARIVALPTPNDRQRTQWYFQRYVSELPAAGEIVLFDRSWYNRAGVERVMGYCSEDQAKAFLKQAPVFEQLLVDDDVLLFKYWLTVDQAGQEERFAERLANPLKRWKLSPVDLQARSKYADYGRARDSMLRHPYRPRALEPGRLQRPAARPHHADPASAGPSPGAPGARAHDRVPAAGPRAAARALRNPAQAHRSDRMRRSRARPSGACCCPRLP